MARRLELEYVADASGFTRGTKQARDELGRFVKQSDTDTKKVSGGLGKAGAAVAGFAGGIASQFAGRALDAVAGFAGGTITAASDMNETISKSRAIFGAQAGAVEKWAGDGAKNFGLAKADALSYAAGLGDMASQIGLTGKESAKFGQDLVQVSADLGSFNNLETGDVLDRITAAMRGEYDSLQALIPNINAARVEQEAMAATGKKTAKELTAQDKALAVQAILHKDGARAMGDFAKTSGGLANQQKIAAAQVQDLQAKLGTALLPVLTTVMAFITGTAIPALTQFADWFTTNLGPAVADFAGSLGGVMPALQAFGGFLADNARVLLPLAAGVAAIVAAIRIWSAVQAVLNVVLAANPIGIIVIAIAALVAGLIYAYHNSEDFRRIVDATFKAVQTTVSTVIGAVVGALGFVADSLTRTWQTAVDFGVRVVRAFLDLNRRIADTVSGLVRSVVGFFTDLRDRAVRLALMLKARVEYEITALQIRASRLAKQIRDNVVGFFTGLRDRAVSLVLNLRDRFFSGLRSLRDGAVNIATQIRTWITDRIRALVTSGVALVYNLRDRFFGGLRSLRDGARNIATQVREWVIGRFKALVSGGVSLIYSLRDRVFGALRSLRDGAANIANRARDLVVGKFTSIRDRITSLFTSMRDTVGRVFSGLLEKVKGPLRTVFSWINRNLIKPLNSVTSKFGLTIPDLPKFHKGGEIPGRGERPIMALGGEGVLSRRGMRNIGGKRGLDLANAGGPGDWWNNFTEFISRPARLVAEMAKNGVKWAVGQVLGAIPNIPSTGNAVADVVPGIINAMKSRALAWAGDQEAKQQAELGTAGGSIGSGPWVRPIGAGIGNGYLGYPGHYGVDMPAGTGTRVHAVSNAVVSKAASLTYSYGKHLMLRHADGLVTVYAHLSQLLAHAGQSVKTGQVIGLSGSTGNSSGPHLHFETRVGGGYPGPNPRSVMAARGVTLDSGGMLQPGLTLVRNGTGGPEPVLTPSQFAAMRGAATQGGGTTIIINGVLDKQGAAREIRQLLESDARSRGGVVVKRGA